MSNLNTVPKTGRFGDAVDAINANFTLLDEQMAHFYSAYQVWVQQGHTGTVDDFLQSLTAYGIAVENGFVGTQQQWLASLKGERGNDGVVLDGVLIPNSLVALAEYTTAEKGSVVPSGNVIDEVITETYELTDGISRRLLLSLDKIAGTGSSSSSGATLTDGTLQAVSSGASTRKWDAKALSADISAGDVLCIVMTNKTDYSVAHRVAFFNKNLSGGALPDVEIGDAYIAGTLYSLTIPSGDTKTRYHYVPVPDGATHVCVSNYYQSSSKYAITSVYKVTDKVEDILGDTTFHVTESVSYANYYTAADGSTKNHNSFRRYSFINRGYNRVRAYIGLNSDNSFGMVPIAFFDSDGNFLSESSTPALYTSTSIKWYEAVVPSSAYYIRVSHRTTSGTEDIIAYGAMGVAMTAHEKAKDVESATGEIKSDVSRNATIAGRIAIYNQRAALITSASSFNADVFAPFVKEREKFGKRVCAKCVLPRVVSAAIQGGAIYGNLLVCASSTGNVLFVGMRSGKRLQFSNGLIAAQNAHNNCAFFGTEKYDENDTYPIIYFSGYSDTPIYGYRITGTSGNYDMTLVQTINLPAIADTGYTAQSPDAYLYNGSLYTIGKSAADSDLKLVMKWAMPSLSQGSVVTLDMSDRQEITPGVYSFTFNDPGTTQSGFVKDGILYSAYYYGIFAVNLLTGAYLGSFRLKDVINMEYETCFMHNGNLYVVGANRNTDEIESLPTVEIYYVELNLATNVSALTNDAGYLTSHQDISGKEDRVGIATSLPNGTLSLNTYYALSTALTGAVTVTLPSVSDNTHVSSIALSFETGSGFTSLTITPPSGVTVSYYDGYSIEAGKEYEINLLWNGSKWIVSYAVIE